MEQLVEKMKTYLTMETPIPFQEFVTYYQDVLAFLQQEFQNLNQDALITMTSIVQTVSLNATDRSLTKDSHSKKFKKMAEKMKFWYDALGYKLKKEYGMSEDDIDTAINAVFED